MLLISSMKVEKSMMHVVKVWLASAIKITCTMLQFRLSSSQSYCIKILRTKRKKRSPQGACQGLGSGTTSILYCTRLRIICTFSVQFTEMIFIRLQNLSADSHYQIHYHIFVELYTADFLGNPSGLNFISSLA